jgi:hypothetical protein
MRKQRCEDLLLRLLLLFGQLQVLHLHLLRLPL